MIANNKFYIENIKNVVFIGYSEVFFDLIRINKFNKINSIIITSPDQAKYISKDISFKIFKELDSQFKKFINKNTQIKNTIFISLGARNIFKKDVIENFFLNNLVNFHGSRLPLDAGGGGYSWRIMREDRIDNQLVHLVNESLDAGPIIDYEASLFPKECQIPKDFENYRLKKFINFYEKFINKLKKGYNFELKSQIDYLGNYNPRLNTEKDGLINWDMNSYDLINFINAFDEPYSGASTFLNNKKIYIKNVQLHGGENPNHPFMAGLVYRHDKKWIVVSTASKHMLLIEKILDKKGKNIINQIKVGDRFYTLQNKLGASKSKRTHYNSFGKKKN